MPLYEYHCSKCDKNFEVLQRFSDAPVTTHEECGGVVERVLSAPAFQFKGSGWYVTDYGKGGVKPGASDGSSEKKSGDSEKKSDAEKKSADSKSNDSKSAETKSESKSESKSDAKSSSESKPAAKTD